MIQNDSRKIKTGDTFIAIKGIVGDGHDYISDARKHGAKRIICEHGDGIIVEDTNNYLKKYLKRYYYHKIKNIKLIGVTGTNGKTTTCFSIYQALSKLGIKCAYIGTIGFYKNDICEKLTNTTPDLLEIYQLLLRCRDCEYVVMEVSSQGLAYGRLDTLKFNYAIFTNLTEDHLDYHKTIENYALAKQKLFTQLLSGKSIINVDDQYNHYFKTNNMITYGFNGSDYQINKYHIRMNRTKFSVNNKKYKTKLIGKHNVYNLTCVIILLEKLGFTYRQIYKVINQINPVIGRMETIKYHHSLIVIDYAHTPDAVEKAIKSVRKLGKRIITIIGCGGNRDKLKRPIMGNIATKLSDYVIFTSDNPRWEDPKNILNDIVKQLDSFNYEIDVNRSKAIEKGIQMLTKGDILLVLGKGHEDYQIIGDQKYHFNDKEEVLKYIGR